MIKVYIPLAEVNRVIRSGSYIPTAVYLVNDKPQYTELVEMTIPYNKWESWSKNIQNKRMKLWD